jgi:hypothetical protein
MQSALPYTCPTAARADSSASALRMLLTLILMAVALVSGGCGGGGDGGERRSGFINFTNAPDGEIVLDADNDIFRVTEREGCLWSEEYGFVTDWCLVGSGNRLDFGGSSVVLVSHPGSFGGCVTVLAEERSLFIVDIYINSNGYMDYAISNVPALRC